MNDTHSRFTASIKRIADEARKGKRKQIDFHNSLMVGIQNFATENGHTGFREVEIVFPHPRFGVPVVGRLDVTWNSAKGNRLLAVEIDSSLKTRSLAKLKASGAAFKSWVYYGNKVADFLSLTSAEADIIPVVLDPFSPDALW